MASGRDLRSGHSKSCGCYCRDLNSNLKTKEMVGQKFGRLTVVQREGTSSNGCATWRCRCECGNEVVVTGGNLRSGNTTSCGCFFKEMVASNNTKSKTTHGKTNTRLHTIWSDMKQRCGNPKDHFYYIYGGRGISVCDEWKNDFQAFYDWAIHNGYRDDLTIDRKNNDQGYCPDNCRWATWKEQANNKRRKSKCVRE